MSSIRSFSIGERDGAWVSGSVNGLEFRAKVFDEPSWFGIDDGRVSKLFVPGLVWWDRGIGGPHDAAFASRLAKMIELSF